jgi:hypothetical protein
VRRVLSARSTIFYHLLPLLWLVAVAAVAWLVRREPAVVLATIPVALIPWVVMRWSVGSLRHVSTDGRMLYVRGRGREAAIPFSEIAEVRESKPGGTRRGVPTVTLTLKSDSPVGRKIRFIPRMRWFPDAEALGRAQSLQHTDPEAAAMALWATFSAAEEIRQQMRGVQHHSATPDSHRYT